jgi:hypothetical protein
MLSHGNQNELSEGLWKFSNDVILPILNCLHSHANIDESQQAHQIEEKFAHMAFKKKIAMGKDLPVWKKKWCVKKGLK